MRIATGLYFIFLILLSGGCVPVEESKPAIEVKFSWKDPVIRQIYEWEIEQDLDSMEIYARAKQPAYRYAVARSLSSILDDRSLDILIPMLQDSVPKVVEQAAYAVGQLGDPSAADAVIAAFRAEDSLELFLKANGKILEAAGKCGDARTLELLSSISTYTPRDTILLLGQARGIYHLMLRNYTSASGHRAMARFVSNTSFPTPVRTIAANYFYRLRNFDIKDYTYTFKKVVEDDNYPHIRMAMAALMARFAPDIVLEDLVESVLMDGDYRVKVNFIRGLGDRLLPELELDIRANLAKYPYPLQVSAARYLLNSGHEEGSIGYWDMARRAGLHYETAHLLAAAASKHLPFYYSITRQQVRTFLQGRYSEADDIYEKRSALLALSSDPENIGFLIQASVSEEDPILQSAIAEAMATVYEECQERNDPSLARSAERRIIPAAQALMLKGDPGASAITANFLRNHWQSATRYVRDTSGIRELMETFDSPEALETKNAIKHLLATIEGVSYQPYESQSVMDMDWEIFDRWPSNPEVSIKTNRGTFAIELFKDIAPMTVVNFLKLTKSGYFNGKVIHRVVPNFVIQTGCPRGDGYGSLEYTIRSELNGPEYESEGYVGMASAGNHTESSQWFVTHCPAFHLDGNYTAFGYITSGMNVVHDMQVGDQIQTVTIN